MQQQRSTSPESEHASSSTSTSALRLHLRIGPAPQDVQSVELRFYKSWRPRSRRLMNVSFVRSPISARQGQNELDGDEGENDDLDYPHKRDLHPNNRLEFIPDIDHDADDADDDDHLTTVTYSWARYSDHNTSSHPTDVIALPEPIDLTHMLASPPPPSPPPSTPPPAPHLLFSSIPLYYTILAVLVASLCQFLLVPVSRDGVPLWQPAPAMTTTTIAQEPRDIKFVASYEVVLNNYLAVISSLAVPVTPAPPSGTSAPLPSWFPPSVLDNLRREIANACATAHTIQRRRELSPETVAGVRHAFPVESIVKSCDAAHADLVKATRLIDDLQLVNTARILESLRGTLAASWAALADTSVPVSHSMSGEGGRGRNETADRIARVVLSAVSSFEEDHAKLAEPITRLLDHLDAAKHIEQQIILPFLATIRILPATSEALAGHIEARRTSYRLLTTYFLPRRDDLLELLRDAIDHLSRARAELRALRDTTLSLSAGNWHGPVTVFQQAGSHVSCSGAVHLEAAARRVHVRWHFEHTSVTTARLQGLGDDIAETTERLTDVLSKFHQEEPAIIISEDDGMGGVEDEPSEDPEYDDGSKRNGPWWGFMGGKSRSR